MENECEKMDRLMELYMRWVLLNLFIFYFYLKFIAKLIKRRIDKAMVATVSRLILFILIDNILNYSYACCRYSNRVKAETDRIDQLEFDDLEVTVFLSF